MNNIDKSVSPDTSQSGRQRGCTCHAVASPQQWRRSRCTRHLVASPSRGKWRVAPIGALTGRRISTYFFQHRKAPSVLATLGHLPQKGAAKWVHVSCRRFPSAVAAKAFHPSPRRSPSAGAAKSLHVSCRRSPSAVAAKTLHPSPRRFPLSGEVARSADRGFDGTQDLYLFLSAP